CGKKASFRVAGSKMMEYCAQHAPDGMVDVTSRKCRTDGCGKRPSFRLAGTKTAEYWAQHAPKDVVDGYNRKSETEGCGKKPPSEVANTRSAEYCAQHARLQCDVEGFRERKVGPHHSGKKIIDNVISSGAKQTT
ncbi:unnamed protein product, partial [Ascophyllum nodosum]